MKTKVSELTGSKLDWAVAKCEGVSHESYMYAVVADATDGLGHGYQYSTNWSQSGPIIEREGITINKKDGYWSAYFLDKLFEEDESEHWNVDETPLIAAMRCYIESKLGDEIDIPEELNE